MTFEKKATYVVKRTKRFSPLLHSHIFRTVARALEIVEFISQRKKAKIPSTLFLNKLIKSAYKSKLFKIIFIRISQ